MVKIYGQYWLARYPINSGNHKSFGPVKISDLYTALKAVYEGRYYRSKHTNRDETDIVKWIQEHDFLCHLPYELILPEHITEEAFIRILCAYNPNLTPFIEKHPDFYLWVHA